MILNYIPIVYWRIIRWIVVWFSFTISSQTVTVSLYKQMEIVTVHNICYDCVHFVRILSHLRKLFFYFSDKYQIGIRCSKYYLLLTNQIWSYEEFIKSNAIILIMASFTHLVNVAFFLTSAFIFLSKQPSANVTIFAILTSAYLFFFR